MGIKEELLGTSWSLIAYKSADVDGKILYPLGEDVKGTIIFTNEQQTAVQIMANDREQIPSEEMLARYNTEAEKQMARLGYHAYTGPFDFDEEKSELTTHVKMSVLTTYVNSDQTRAARIEGNKLYLSNVQHPERQLVWERIEK